MAVGSFLMVGMVGGGEVEGGSWVKMVATMIDRRKKLKK